MSSESYSSSNDKVVKKVKPNEDNNELKISRKTSDDIVKYIERMPSDQIDYLLNYVKQINSPDLHIKLDMSKIMPKDNFSLDEEEESENKRKRRESKEKECKCCKQVVKRHHCQHTNCEKPCNIQDKGKKIKE